jgi:hypothetical protein
MTVSDAEHLYKYALMLSDRLLEASKDSRFTHETLGLANSIAENVSVLRGEIPAREYTSLGTTDFLEYQIKLAELRLESIAKCLLGG